MLVLLDLLARRDRHLDEHGVLDVEVPVVDELAERAQPGVDALGVVEPVAPQEHPARPAQRGPDLLRAGRGLRARGQRLEARRVDRDRERRRADGPPVREVDEVAVRLVPDQLPHQPDEVLGAAGQLEADQVGAEESLEDLAPPRQLLEQLGRRERDVQVEADPQVGAQLAQHPRHQLQLVVVDPDRRVLGGLVRGRRGEPLVDLDVALPPLPVELRLGDEVVVERPQRGVGEALVVPLDVLGRHRERYEREAVVLERLEVLVGAARPAHPDAVVAAEHRLDRAHQAARRPRPPGRPVRRWSPGRPAAGWRRSPGRGARSDLG